MTRIRAAIAALIAIVSTHAAANDTYQTGRINDITVAGNSIMIKLDTGMPDNCAGTMFGWMEIPEAYKAIQSLVLGMWLRGDAAQTVVIVSTNATVAGGYCRVNQINPEN